MTGTPPSFADTPGSPAAAGARCPLRHAAGGSADRFGVPQRPFTAPFGVVSPQRYHERMPMAHLRHISIFHLIAAGGCTVETASGQRREVKAGDLLLMPFADEHKFLNGDAVEMAFASDIVRRGMIEGIWTANHGGGGAETRMVSGANRNSDDSMKPQTIRVSAPPPPWFAVHMPSITPATNDVGGQRHLGGIAVQELVLVRERHQQQVPGFDLAPLPLAVSTVQPPAAIR